MGIVLENALLCDLDPLRVEPGSLRLADGQIVARGSSIATDPGDEKIDCHGAAVLPGLVNGHTHLYSAFAVGMPPPTIVPESFHDILKFVWWRLDRAHNADSMEWSARIGALDALHCGTTTIIDHHASPSIIGDSLDMIEAGIDAVGLRGVLCYETTDRNGLSGREAGIAENRRYLRKTNNRPHNRRFGALAGAHASFTCQHESLEALARLAEEFRSGVHIHVAEDPVDEAITQEEFGLPLIKRLIELGILTKDSVFAHCTHLGREALDHVNDVGPTIAHNTRSNMNNAVGYAPMGEFQCPVMLGTDGIGADMFTEARVAWFRSSEAKTGLTPRQVTDLLAQGARRASQALGITLGKLEEGAAADVVVTGYVPSTPLETRNLAGHLLFGIEARHVRHVTVDGKWALRDGRAMKCDEAGSRRTAQPIAKALWNRMEEIF